MSAIGSQILDQAAGLILLAAILYAYILPGLIASHRRHPRRADIWQLTLGLSWTGAGWVLLMLWACRTARTPATI